MRFIGGDVSAVQLVRDSGLVENPGSLSRDCVLSFLKGRPELVECWLQWSQDKRVSSGWYFSRHEEGFIVGYHPEGARTKFENMIDACAEFVLREVESIAQELRSNKSLERGREP